MTQELKNILSICLKKLKVPLDLVIIFSLIVCTFWYIVGSSPSPHITVPGHMLIFELPAFEHSHLTFLNPIAIENYSISESNKRDTKGTYTSYKPSYKKNIQQKSNHIKIEYSAFKKFQTNLKTKKHIRRRNIYSASPPKSDETNQRYRISIYSPSSSKFEIEAFSIDGKKIKLKSFFDNNLKINGSEYTRFNYIRKDIAEKIYLLNDPISNWLLTFISFSIMFLIGKILLMEIRAHVYTDLLFKKHILGFLKIKDISQEAKYQTGLDEYFAYWGTWDTRFRYLQALGPALGFILTVTSLVQALYPQVAATQNLDGFLRGIHVALISTFLGLLLRVIALEGSRVNDILLRRTDLMFTEETAHSLSDVSYTSNGDSLQ